MEYSLTDIGPCRKSLVFKFSAAEVDEALDASYAEVDRHVQIKGFRKGKAPRRILEKKFSSEARQGALESISEKNVGPTIEKEKVVVLGPLEGENSVDMLQPGQPFTLTVEFDCRPDFEMPKYKGLELNEHPVSVEEEKVDEGIERFRKMFATHDPVDGPAQVGDILNVNFKGSANGREIMNVQDKNLRVEGEQLFGLHYPELEAKFTGAKAEDKINLTINLPEDHPEDELKGKPADVEIDVIKVQRPRLPEMNDEFAANLGMTDLASFRERIRSNLMSEALVGVRIKQEQEIIDQLIAATSFIIPEKSVKAETEAILNHERQELARKGVAGAALEKAVEAQKEEAAKTAERRVRWEIISSRIIEDENLQVTQDEITNHVNSLAQSYNTTPAKILQRVREFNGVQAMLKEIMDIKVLQFLLDETKGGKNDSDTRAKEIQEANAAASDTASGEKA